MLQQSQRDEWTKDLHFLLISATVRARGWSEMIEHIRSLPDFERFLVALTENELKAAAASGPVVIVNVSEYRCDALIIEKNKLRALPLPQLAATSSGSWGNFWRT